LYKIIVLFPIILLFQCLFLAHFCMIMLSTIWRFKRNNSKWKSIYINIHTGY